MRVLVTGTAGFIGFYVAARLLADGHFVVGYDGMTPYYDVRLKQARHAILSRSNGFKPVIGQMEDMDLLTRTAEDIEPEVIIHLAGQAGVRYSIEAPRAYVDSNLVGSFNVLEIARQLKPRHLLMASTSSVYGLNPDTPFGETDRADHQITLYAATKKAMEAMSHSYAHLWQLPTTCFRFFTVYGPWGRPDMAPLKFIDAIANDRPIDVYGDGRMWRDFTYIDDLVEAIIRLIDAAPRIGEPVPKDQADDSLSPVAPWRVVNIAGGHPVLLTDFITAIEAAVGKPARRNMLPMQQGDVRTTHADSRLLEALTGFLPQIRVEEGVRRLAEWYRTDYRRL